jgi:pimeloyl-ACP methyl ester carboxylesterase
VFEPATGEADLGFIFYPGGRVDYRSYAPLAHRIAAEGYRVIIVSMPLNLAVFAPGRAAQVIQAYPEIEDWVIGGHSLGGAMAANYVYRHPQAVQGLVLWASFPASNNSLSDLDIPCLSIYGSQDGEVEKIRESAALLPADTRWVEITGGNHAQFGWYGPQSGDGQATIGHDEQQEAILTATLDFLAIFPH